MESNKVKLPSEVIDAIKAVFHINDPFMREKQFHNIIHIRPDTPCTAEQATVYNYFVNKGWLVLAKALNDGWEVEQTPEDKVREYFNKLLHAGEYSITNSISEVLDILNIKIKGVNDHETN